jgi:hypothetical protein
MPDPPENLVQRRQVKAQPGDLGELVIAQPNNQVSVTLVKHVNVGSEAPIEE